MLVGREELLARDLAEEPKLGIKPRLRPAEALRAPGTEVVLEGRVTEALTVGLEVVEADVAGLVMVVGAPAPLFQTFFTAPTAPFKNPNRE